MGWKGIAITLGSAGACQGSECKLARLAGIFESNYVVSADGSYSLDSSNVIPN